MLDDGAPLFQQIADQLSSDIVDGTLAEGGKVPSSNEFAAFYRINPATAAKGINLLVDEGILEKRRGIGMFVVIGARSRLIQLRRREFAEQYVDPLIVEATRIGIDTDALIEMIRRPAGQQHGERLGTGPFNNTGPFNATGPIGGTGRNQGTAPLNNTAAINTAVNNTAAINTAAINTTAGAGPRRPPVPGINPALNNPAANNPAANNPAPINRTRTEEEGEAS